MNTRQKIQDKLNERSFFQRAAALLICLAVIVGFCVPVQLMVPGIAATSEDIPPGAYSIANDISNVMISNVTNGDVSGDSVNAAANADYVSFSMKVDFVINDTTHDKIDTSKPYIYLPVAKEQLEILLLDPNNKTGSANDSSSGWTDYRQINTISDPSTGTYEIFPTEDGEYGYVILKFRTDYVKYVKQSNGIVTGSLRFDGRVNRDDAQSGEKTIRVGNAEIAVNFDDREPTLGKSVSQSFDEIGCPILQWTVNVKDLYETDQYTITDEMLADAFDFTCYPDGVCYLENGQLHFNETINHNKEFSFSYKTRVTPEQLKAHTDPFDITNSVKLNGVEKTSKTETITPDSAPHLQKSGTPDYLYFGDRSGETNGKHYIYWTVNVDRNYGIPLAGLTLTDTPDEKQSNLTMLSASAADGSSIALTDLFTDTTGTSWTFKDDVTASKVTLLYRTEVSGDSDRISNQIAITGGESKTPTVDYHKNAQHEAHKTGFYVAEEDAEGNPVEYIEWTIEVYAKSGTSETVNGYTIEDSAFGTEGFTWKSVEARNDGQQVSVSADTLFSSENGNGTTRIVTDSPVMDYLKMTYRVPVGTIEGRSETSGGKAKNTFKVEQDQPEVVEVDVPTLAGQSTVTVNKYWDNAADPNKEQTTATFTLYYRIGSTGEWACFSTYKNDYHDTITVNGTQSGQQQFTDLPAYDTSDGRKPFYYKVVETIQVPDGVTDRYEQQFTTGNADGAKGAQNPTFGLTNTWMGTNVEGIKNWKDDEGHEAQRPAVALTLQSRKLNSNNDWTDVTGVTNPLTADAAGNWRVLWQNLPKKDTDGNDLEYQIVEKNTPDGYTSHQDSYTSITNTYNCMTITAEKLWARVDSDEDKPDEVQFKLMRTTDQYNGEWVDVENSTITLQKADYAKSLSHLRWTDLPKTDAENHPYYYKVVEIRTTEKQQEFTPSYSIHNGWGEVVAAANGSCQMDVTNTWNKTNITVTKQWQGDTGNEHYRPNIVLALEKSENYGDWAEVSRVKLCNDGNGNYKPENNDQAEAGQTYTWTGLEAGDSIRYRVREVEMRELKRGSSQVQESGKIDTGYDGYYEGVGNTTPKEIYSTSYDPNSRNAVIINQSNMMTIRVDKVWEGVPGEYRADQVGYRLYRWTESQFNSLSDAEKYTDTYKFSDKYAFKSASGESDTIYWTWMLTKDQNGEPYHYGLREIAVSDRDPGVTEGDAYTIDRSDEYETEVIAGEVVNQNQTFTVKNTWKRMNVSIRKVWEGGTNEGQYRQVRMKLMQKIGEDGTWEEVSGAGEKIVTAGENWRLDNAWTGLPRENAVGQKIYYRAEEVSSKNKNDTETVSITNGTCYPDANGVHQSSLSVSKTWTDDEDRADHVSITLQLMKKVGDGEWVRVDGEDRLLTGASGWKINNAWRGLPLTEKVGETDVDVWYRAQEISAVKYHTAGYTPVSESEDFYTCPDAAGINATGDSVVTNTPKKITIQMQKHWVSTQGTPKPESIKVTLMASTNGGASWVTADQISSSITAEQTIPVEGDNDLSAEWENLPTRTTVGSTERDVVYKLVEDEVSGYSASYSSEMVTTNSTVTITNTEKSPYTKKAANPAPSLKPVFTNANDGSNRQQLSGVDLLTENDGILQNNTLSSENISTVDTAIVNLNGVDTECYLFKWRVDMLTNQTQSDNNTGYTFTDTLTDGSVFYDDCGEHGIEIITNGSGTKGMYRGRINELYPGHAYWYDSEKYLSVTYDKANTVAVFDMQTPENGKSVSYITYYTATPKSVVDAALAAKGEFSLTNRIRESKETTPNEITLHVTGGDDIGYIDKINNTASGTENGYAAMKEGTAHYKLDVNKDSRYLSAGNTVSVTDIFRILDYTPKDGETQSGTDVTAVPGIANVAVFHYDTDGRRTKVDADQYSYAVSEENDYYRTTEDYSDQFTNADIGNYAALVLNLQKPAPKGLELMVKLSGGTPNAQWTINQNSSALYTDPTVNQYVKMEFPEANFNETDKSGYFDSSGNLLIKLTFLQDTPKDNVNGNQFNLQMNGQDISDGTWKRSVESAILKTATPVKNYITKFTLPDGGHYEILYDYVIRNADGTELESGSTLTLQNEASVHTSGGDKKDESRKTTYCVQKSEFSTRVGQNFEIVKVDIGSKSIKDLNAEFKLAKFDSDNNRWIYADAFSFQTITVGSNSYLSDTLHVAGYSQDLTETSGNIPDDAANMVLKGSFEIELEKTVLYKVVEVKAPDNHEDFEYPKPPYQTGDHTVAGNAGNTYYFLYNEGGSGITALTEEQITARATAAGITKDQIRVATSADPSLVVPNVRLIDIGAEKSWEQDPNSKVNDVQVAVQLLRSATKDIRDAAVLEGQENYLAAADLANYDSTMQAYILKKETAWKQTAIWHDLPNGDLATQQPYYYFIREVGYKIGEKWYTYNSTTGRYEDSDGNVWTDVSGNSAEYKPSYTDDAANSSGVIRIVNSRKLLVKKQWLDKNGKAIASPPVNAVDFNLYGITADGTEVRIALPEDKQKLTAPNWEIEVPQDLITGEGISYMKYRIEEAAPLEDFIVSDVYALNGNIGVIYLINKNTNPTSVDVHVSKTWADGNDAHGTADAVTFTLYQFTGKQTINQAFIESFIAKNKVYNGVTQVSGVINPIILDGTEADPWQYTWQNLPFRGGTDNAKLQYFVLEEQSETTAGSYQAAYTLDGNTAYAAERSLDVTNRQPGVLVIKKLWRDKTLADMPVIPNAKYGDIQVKLYRKVASEVQIADAEAEDILTRYGLTESDLVTGVTDVDGLASDGTITLGQSNAWTVSLSGLDTAYCYYIVEADGTGYSVTDYAPQYSNEGQKPGSDKLMTVENFIEGERITVKAQKTWSYTDNGTIQTPASIALNLQQYDTINQKWVTIRSQTVTADSGSGWEAEWNDLPASKRYQVVEEVPAGWLAAYGEAVVDTSGETEIRSYPVTNVLDTGELKVKKKWLANDPGNATSVTVELWRQAYDGDEPYIPPVVDPVNEEMQTQGSRSFSDKMFSMRRVQAALAEVKTDEPIVQTEVVEETTVPAAVNKPNLTISAGKTVLATSTSYTDNIGTYIPLSGLSGDWNTDLSYNLGDLCTEYEVTSVGLVFDEEATGNYYTKVGLTGSNGTLWMTGNKTGTILQYSSADDVGWGISYISNPLSKIELNTQAVGNNEKHLILKEIRFYYTPTGPTVSITDKPGNTAVVSGDTATLTATTTGGTIIWTSSNNDAATVDSNGNITFKQVSTATEVTITASATDAGTTNSDSVTYTVTPFTITGKDNLSVTRTEGGTVDLTANAAAYWGSSDETIAAVDANGKVTFLKNGSVTIIATHGAVSDTVTFTVSSLGFTPTVTPATVHVGGTATLSAGLEGVTWTVKPDGNNGAATLDGSTVTATQNGDVTFIGTRGSVTQEVRLHIASIMVTYNNENIVPANLTMNVNSSIPVLNIVGTPTAISSDANVAWYDPDTQTVKTGEKVGETTITITDEGGGSLQFTVKTEVTEANANVPATAVKVQDITISTTQNWLSSAVTDLPKTDGLGHTYRYFIKETATDAFIPVAYSTSAQGAELSDVLTQLELTNASQQNDTPVELPESGSTGTKVYYTVGGVLLLLSAAGYTMIKRRRWYDE